MFSVALVVDRACAARGAAVVAVVAYRKKGAQLLWPCVWAHSRTAHVLLPARSRVLPAGIAWRDNGVGGHVRIGVEARGGEPNMSHAARSLAFRSGR